MFLIPYLMKGFIPLFFYYKLRKDLEIMGKVKYGEIYYYDFGNHEGSIQNGLRPALVIQDDRLNAHSPTTLIAAITSVTKKTYLPSHAILGKQFGLKKPSMVLIEQIACVNQTDLGDYVGAVDDSTMRRIIRNAIKKTFGIWDYPHPCTADVRCLCPECLRKYISNNKYFVKRFDPFEAAKYSCDKCNSLGYQYILIPRIKDQNRENVRF